MESMRLAGAHEVRELLGVSRQRVYQLAARADFPTPVAVLAQGKIWLVGDIEEWIAEHRPLVAWKMRGRSLEPEGGDLPDGGPVVPGLHRRADLVGVGSGGRSLPGDGSG